MRPVPSSRALGLLALLGFFAYDAHAQLNASAPVRLGETVVFTLSATHGQMPASERARQASVALAQVVQADQLPEVRVQRSPDTASVYAGETAIVELIEADATLAGEASLDAHAAKSADLIRQALAAEHKRSRIAETVFSLSLVVFFALIAFYLIKKVASGAERLRTWLEEHGDRSFALRVKSIELVRPAVLKNAAIIVLGLLKWVVQFGIFYAWLVVVLSLFETTRGYTERLTGLVLAPLSQLMGRAFTALPMLVMAGFVGLAVFALVRFTKLFLASVARRETSLAWLPADLAPTASVLVRISIVLGALVFAAPIVTGSTEGSLGRTGAVVLVTLGLAATPLFASGLLGAVVLFGRRLAVGEYVQIQGRLGRIASINLLELRLQTSDGTEQRIPHLLLLAHSIERMGPAPRLSVEVVVPADVPPARVLELLTAAGERTGRDASAELVSVEPAGARYRVTATCSSLSGRSPLLQGVVEALATTGVSVGRGAPHARPG
jgi:small-conductance mechanosensitive channel